MHEVTRRYREGQIDGRLVDGEGPIRQVSRKPRIDDVAMVGVLLPHGGKMRQRCPVVIDLRNVRGVRHAVRAWK